MQDKEQKTTSAVSTSTELSTTSIFPSSPTTSEAVESTTTSNLIEDIQDATDKLEVKRNAPKLVVSIHPAELFLENPKNFQVTSEPRKMMVSTEDSKVFLYFGREEHGTHETNEDLSKTYDKVLTKYDRTV